MSFNGLVDHECSDWSADLRSNDRAFDDEEKMDRPCRIRKRFIVALTLGNDHVRLRESGAKFRRTILEQRPRRI